MSRRGARRLGWAGAVVLVVVLARALAYALAPAPGALVAHLAGQAGGPSLLWVAGGALALAGALAALLVWLTGLGLRERDLVAGRPVRRHRVSARRLLSLWARVAVASVLLFTVLESYLHWRAGLGVHGLSCLFGPVHADALPLLLALSLVAAAAGVALGLVLAAAADDLGALYGARLRIAARRERRVVAPALTLRSRRPRAARPARGPPLLVAL